MLTVAERKRVYDRLHRAALGTVLPFPNDYFAGVVSAGVFTTGHVGAEGIDELIRCTKPGGVLILTVKDTVWASGFAARIAELEAAGTLRLIEETQPYVSMPGQPGTIPGRGVALGVK